MPVSAQTVAEYLLAFFQDMCDPIPSGKLHRLLYYVQGWHLGLHGEPAFDDRIEAWIAGPTCPSIQSKFEHLRWAPIIEPVQRPEITDLRLKQVIDEVIDEYGMDTGFSLHLRSRAEPPWQEARKGLSNHDESCEEISHDSMRRFFREEATRPEEA